MRGIVPQMSNLCQPDRHGPKHPRVSRSTRAGAPDRARRERRPARVRNRLRRRGVGLVGRSHTSRRSRRGLGRGRAADAALQATRTESNLNPDSYPCVRGRRRPPPAQAAIQPDDPCLGHAGFSPRIRAGHRRRHVPPMLIGRIRRSAACWVEPAPSGPSTSPPAQQASCLNEEAERNRGAGGGACRTRTRKPKRKPRYFQYLENREGPCRQLRGSRPRRRWPPSCAESEEPLT